MMVLQRTFLSILVLSAGSVTLVESIHVCHDGKTKNVARSQLAKHRMQGDKLGKCKEYPGNKVRICHNPGKIERMKKKERNSRQTPMPQRI